MMKAYQEYQAIQNQYRNWSKNMLNKLGRKIEEEEKEEIIKHFEVPELIVQMPIDERESNIKSTEEW